MKEAIASHGEPTEVDVQISCCEAVGEMVMAIGVDREEQNQFCLGLKTHDV